MPDLGEGFEAIETIVDFFEKKNEQLNYQLLEAKSEIPMDYFSQTIQSKTTVKN
jgi:hypothetical protein